MPDFYSLARGELTLLLQTALHASLNAGDVICPSRVGHATTAAALRLKLDAELLAEQIRVCNAERPLILLGVPALESADAVNGYINFTFSSSFFTAAMQKVIDTIPLQPVSEIDFRYPVLGRLRAMAHKPFAPCPDDPRVMRALWLALGLAGESGDGARGARLNEALSALSGMTHHIAKRDRQALIRRCSGVAGCAARLMQMQMISK